MIKMSFQTNGTGTQTHDLRIASLIPQPLDQGSGPDLLNVYWKSRN